MFHDTGLGRVLGLDSKKQKPDIESSPSWWLSSENYKLSLKLESARIPANTRHAHWEAAIVEASLSIGGSLSTVFIGSDDTQTNEKKVCAAADCALGWNGPDDPEVLSSRLSNHPSTQDEQLISELFAESIKFPRGPKGHHRNCHTSTYHGRIYSIFSPGIVSMAAELHTTELVGTLGTSLSMLGYAIGPMLWSPISECPSIGRNPVYIATLGIFVLIQIPIALATNIETVLIFRFLSGVFGSPPQATGGATLSDIYLPRRRSYALGLWELSAWAAPTLGPLAGGVAVQYWGWRSTIWELVALNSLTFVAVLCFLPETSASNILYRRTKRLQSYVDPKSSKANLKEIPPRPPLRAVIHQTLVRPFTLCFCEPICLLLNTYTALLTGLFFAFFETSPVVFVEIYNLDLVHLGFTFFGLLTGAISSFLIFSVWFRCSESKKFHQTSQRKPEERFVPLMAACAFIPISLFMFGWTARSDIPSIVPIAGSGMFSLGSFSLFVSTRTFRLPY